MSKIEALNPHQHRHLRLNNQFTTGLGYDQGAVMISPSEILDIQREYAIVLRKHPETGRFFMNAMLGLEPKENLLLTATGQWAFNYVPLSFVKGPMLIGFRQGQAENVPIISIDTHDPRICMTEGVAIFNEDQTFSPEMEKINTALAILHQDGAIMDKMITQFIQADLLEPLSLDITLDNGEQRHISGSYTITEEKINQLSATTLASLSQTNVLSAAYYIAGSLSNIQRLITLKNTQLNHQ